MSEFKLLLDGFGARLKEERKKLKLSQSEMADAGSIGRTAQVSYEAGQTFPDVHYLTLIQATGVDMTYILGGSDLKSLSQHHELDWDLVDMAVNEVDTIITAMRENCTHDMRMKFVKDLYEVLKKNNLRKA